MATTGRKFCECSARMLVRRWVSGDATGLVDTMCEADYIRFRHVYGEPQTFTVEGALPRSSSPVITQEGRNQ